MIVNPKRKRDVFRIKKIIEIGLVELNFILEKGSEIIYAYSDVLKKDKSKLSKIMSGEIEAISYKNLQKIDKNEKRIDKNEKNFVINFIGEFIEIADEWKEGAKIVIDCGFFLNLTVSREILKNIGIGDYIFVKNPDIWVYDLEPVEKSKEDK